MVTHDLNPLQQQTGGPLLLDGRLQRRDDGLDEKTGSVSRVAIDHHMYIYASTHLVKDVLELVLSKGGTFDVFDSAQLLGHAIAVLLSDGLHLLASQLLPHGGVIAQIGLGADDQAGDAGAVVSDLGEPLLADIFEGGGGGDGKADEEDVGLRVGQRTETIVILLTGGIEETQRIRFITDPNGEEKKQSARTIPHFFAGDPIRHELETSSRRKSRARF